MRYDTLLCFTLHCSALLPCWCNHQVTASIKSSKRHFNVIVSSPKFFRKLTYIQTLSELAYEVPLTQIDIPPAVYQSVSIHPTYHVLANNVHAEKMSSTRGRLIFLFPLVQAYLVYL
jgi:hypothetical protein